MIIEVRPRRSARDAANNTTNRNFRLKTSEGERAQPHYFAEGKKVKIKLSKKPSKTISEGVQCQKESWAMESETASNFASFRSAFEPRRTCGQMRYFLEVMHKKIRAKSIQNSFQQSNYELDNGVEKITGFRGGKIKQNTLFYNNVYNKLISTSLNKDERKRIATAASVEPSTIESQRFDLLFAEADRNMRLNISNLHQNNLNPKQNQRNKIRGASNIAKSTVQRHNLNVCRHRNRETQGRKTIMNLGKTMLSISARNKQETRPFANERIVSSMHHEPQ